MQKILFVIVKYDQKTDHIRRPKVVIITKAMLNSGIVLLQFAQTPDIFAAQTKLFLTECKATNDQEILDFIEYLEDECIKQFLLLIDTLIPAL